MATADDLITDGARLLPRRAGIPDPRREAAWLLSAAWGVAEINLRLHPNRKVPAEVERRYCDWLERRAAGEPAHHLTGICPFWGRDFEVSPAVLVPRPETELIITAALDLPLSAEARVLDVGTGSGCVAVTLAAERPRWGVWAVDSSAPALAVARRNRDRFGVVVPLFLGDLALSVAPAWDLIVANLPYVPTGDIGRVPVEVRHDPMAALDGGDDGLDLVRRLLSDLPRLLRPCGGAMLELGEDQTDTVASLANDVGLAVARRVRDVGGVDRVIVLQLR